MNKWFKIEARNGRVISPAICRLRDFRLICQWSCIPMIPRGCYLLWSDLRSIGWSDPECHDEDVILNKDDLFGFEETDNWTGCCGPMGFTPNLESSDGIPLAFEFGDCHQSPFIRIPADWHKRRFVTDIQAAPVYLVGVGKFRDVDTIFERACGPDEKVATFRLTEAASKNVRRWMGVSPTAKRALAEMRIVSPNDASPLFDGYGKWLTTKSI